MRPLMLTDGTVLDLDHVTRVDPVGGDTIWRRYMIYMDSGIRMEIYEDYSRNKKRYMARREFIRLWIGEDIT